LLIPAVRFAAKRKGRRAQRGRGGERGRPVGVLLFQVGPDLKGRMGKKKKEGEKGGGGATHKRNKREDASGICLFSLVACLPRVKGEKRTKECEKLSFASEK